ncbi:MAG: hypothetical protein IJP54_00355, partial [Synergistaceae bacterium]|nr:hypothetical protein [Synergistaceae bacterium]
DEAPSFTDVMAMLAQQTAQEQANADSTGSAADQEKANAKASEVAQEVPVAVIPPVEAPERGIYKINPPIQKKDTYKKPIKLRTLKQKKGGAGGASFTFSAAAIDAGEDGTGVFLNSAGDVVENVPGENEWTADGDLIIPGMLTIAMYMEPGTAYTPILTTTSEAASEVEGISTTQEEQETVVTETKTTTLEIPVYDTAEYSTSFDQDVLSYLESRDFNTSIGLFIVAGETYSVNSAAENNMLAATDRAVVQTLPMVATKGENASDLAMYVIKTRLRIPANTATSTISSADHVLEFWPDGLVSINDAGQVTTAATGEAVFLDAADMSEITDDLVRAVAAGQAGYAINSTTWGYDCYVAMTFAKLDDDDDPYTPVLTVKLEDVVSGEEPVIPKPQSPDQPSGPDQPVTTTLGLSASASTVNITLGNSRTVTLSAANVQGTASYAVDAPAAAGVTLSGTTATIRPTAVGTYSVKFTVTDSGRTTNNTATANVTVNVTEASEPEPETPTGTVGSSGGGCDSGFGALALAVLGGFIAARKK